MEGLYAGEVEEVVVEYLIEIHETQAAYLYTTLLLLGCLHEVVSEKRERESFICMLS